ncbi:NAD-dependent epimerase/dehydratase family protein, partial [Actinomadura sp. BRA 177]
MNVLLTGSAGFIGSHIAAALTAAGHRVRGLGAQADGLAAQAAD